MSLIITNILRYKMDIKQHIKIYRKHIFIALLAGISFWYTYKAGKNAGKTVEVVKVEKIPVNILGQGFCISCREKYNWDQLHAIVDEFNKPYKTEQGEFKDWEIPTISKKKD